MPGLLGLLGASSSGAAMVPALQVLTWPFLGLTTLTLSWGWYRALGHRGWRSLWGRRSVLLLVASTSLSALLWGLRFAGLLGARPW
ncbi:MAG: hypothetical protein HY685_00850 [Chloroflexi bacterium]|nr:hypothetical protein [Chloroflexota bacterium]